MKTIEEGVKDYLRGSHNAFEHQKRYDVWPSKSGGMSLSDMTATHINNCISRIKDKGGDMKWLDAFERELLKRKVNLND